MNIIKNGKIAFDVNLMIVKRDFLNKKIIAAEKLAQEVRSLLSY